MDSLCLKAGIHSMVSPPISASASGDTRPSVSAAQPRHSPWGFTFRHPLRSLWPGVKNRYEPAISADDAVLVEEKDDDGAVIIKECDDDGQAPNGNWVFKILHVRSLWRDEGRNGGESAEGEGESAEVEVEEEVRDCGGEDDECEGCVVDDGEEKLEFDKESFSKLLKKVPLAEARMYAHMSFLGALAYSIPKIKTGNLLRNHGLRFATSSIEKREQASKAEKEKESAAAEKQKEANSSAEADGVSGNEAQLDEVVEKKKRADSISINASSAYHIAASAASYLHSHTSSILRFKSSSKSEPNGNSSSDINGGTAGSVDDIDYQEMASLMATTDSVTAVVAAKEDVKQAVADDLKSTHSSPCKWFVCDDDQSATRFFVIQGSESLASWQANLLFEPVQFEGLDFLVHRGIYEAAKGMYEQMLPEIRAHIQSRGEHAMLRFTGHSLGGSLSLLLNLMLLIRSDAPRSSLLPVVTFGAPSIMCGGDKLLHKLRLPQSHIRSIAMHRDIVPRAFSCNYPNHVAEFLKAVNGNFRKHPCLTKQKLLSAPMGEFLILQPDDKVSPSHDLLPSGSGLYVMTCPGLDAAEAEKQIRAAQGVFMNSPHPLEILSDRAAYGHGGTIQRDHDMDSYLKSVRNFIRQELNRIRKARREHRRRVRWPLVAAPRRVDGGIVITSRLVGSGSQMNFGQFNFSGMVQTGRESLKRFSTLVASQHMQLLVVLSLPARLLVLLGSHGLTN